VVLRDENNNRRYALTSPFGYYVFSGVSSNEVYVVSASAKRYRFQSGPQTITLTGTVWNVDFVGTSGGSRSEGVITDGEKSVQSVQSVRDESVGKDFNFCGFDGIPSLFYRQRSVEPPKQGIPVRRTHKGSDAKTLQTQ
jgi:hypothetical protein